MGLWPEILLDKGVLEGQYGTGMEVMYEDLCNNEKIPWWNDGNSFGDWMSGEHVYSAMSADWRLYDSPV